MGREELPLSLDLGLSGSLMSRHTFGRTDFGMDFQFIEHAGLNWDIAAHLRLGYRFQHMSNAHLADHNPGLNLHAVAVSYVF